MGDTEHLGKNLSSFLGTIRIRVKFRKGKVILPYRIVILIFRITVRIKILRKKLDTVPNP